MSDTTMRTPVWRGLNRMPYIEDGQMRSMKNLSSDAYPYLTTRKGREEYKLTTFVPGSPGDGYLEDVIELPKESEEYEGKIVKVVLPENQYIAGEFYYYDGNGWKQGIYDVDFLGIAEEVDYSFKTSSFKKQRYVYGSSTYRSKYEGKIIKYMGKTTDKFTFGKTYEYKIVVTPYWDEWNHKGTYLGEYETIPEASEEYAEIRKYFKYIGEDDDIFKNGDYYSCYLKGYGYWKETEDDVYEPVRELPPEPEGVKQIRYIGNYQGNSVEKAYYRGCEETYKGVELYFYTKSFEYKGECKIIEELPEASAETLGVVYDTGITTGTYYICEWVETESKEGSFEWVETERPQVKKSVTLEEYLTKYQCVGLTKIIEIGQLNEKIAVLFSDENKKIKLYYENQLFGDITDLTEASGKKLQTVGNRLVVGESGCYLYYKKTEENDGIKKELTLNVQEKTFSRTITAGWAAVNERYIDSYIYSAGKGNIVLKFVTKGTYGDGYEEVYNGLQGENTRFKIKLDGNYYFLKVTSVHYDYNKLIGGNSSGETFYADILMINATGMYEKYDWGTYDDDVKKQVTIASVNPHYFDVVAWKKRLWGYDENYIQGTVQDIYNEDGKVDWSTGDNTYTEAIAQPIWQGGNITGLAALSDALILFKEDNLTVFTGNYPAIMSGRTIPCRGLPSENRESVAVANEAVYYLSHDGVYRFSGGLPQCISRDVKIKGTDAVGASDGRKYWLSVKEDDGNYALYVYDIDLGLWHKEDSTAAVSFTTIGGKMYMATDTQIFCLESPQEEVEWEAELWYDEGTHKLKKYKEFHVRGNLGECELYLKADDGEWQAYAFTENNLSVKSEPFMCRELSIRIKGKGICEIKSLDRVFEVVE